MKYELSISKDYVSNWTFWHAVRELAQNAIDNDTLNNTGVFIGKQDSNYIVRSKNTTISPQTLVLGNTAKANDSSQLGMFGEGYKLALVVLLRMGYTITIHNGKDTWTPYFELSEVFETEVLVIDSSIDSIPNGTDLTFIIHNVNQDDIDSTTGKIIKTDDAFETSKGQILRDSKYVNKIYVGNLYVCDAEEEMRYGYNFKPSCVNLGRDRHLMSSFNIQWLSSAMWAELSKKEPSSNDDYLQLVLESKSDISHISNYNSSSSLYTLVADSFYNGRDELCYPVHSIYSMREALLKYSNIIPVMVSDEICEAVKCSDTFTTKVNTIFTKREMEEPCAVVEKYLAPVREQLNSESVEIIDKLIEVSKSWDLNTEKAVEVFKKEFEESKAKEK